MTDTLAIRILLAFFLAIMCISAAIFGNVGSILGSIIDTEDMLEGEQ